jgi:hypothetical protein
MNKDQFIGYLEALEQFAEDGAFDYLERNILINKILEKAKTLEPEYTYLTQPTQPWITFTDDIKPLDWEVKTLPNGDFKVEYK